MKKVLIGLTLISNLSMACLGVDYDTYSAFRVYAENKDNITRAFELNREGNSDLAVGLGEVTLISLAKCDEYAEHVLTEHNKETSYDTKKNMMELRIIVQSFKLWVEEVKKNVK